MAKQQYYIGSTGPFYYDDGDTYRDGEGAGESQTAFYGLATAPAIFGSVKCISSITIGDNVDGADPFIQALGYDNDSIIYWMEDEDYWKFIDDILVNSNEKIHFRDTAIGIYSQADTYLDLFADGGIRIGDSSGGAPTNYVDIKPDGEINLAGTARVLNSIWVDAGGIKSPGAKPATAIAHGTLETPAWQFGNEAVGGNQESVSFNIKIANRMDRSVAPTLTIGWSSTTTSKNVKWQLGYLWIKLNEDTTAGAEETLYATTSSSATAEGMVTSTFIGINVPDSDDICIHCKLTRLSADAADECEDDVELHGICFQWTSNKLGTAT